MMDWVVLEPEDLLDGSMETDTQPGLAQEEVVQARQLCDKQPPSPLPLVYGGRESAVVAVKEELTGNSLLATAPACSEQEGPITDCQDIMDGHASWMAALGVEVDGVDFESALEELYSESDPCDERKRESFSWHSSDGHLKTRSDMYEWVCAQIARQVTARDGGQMSYYPPKRPGNVTWRMSAGSCPFMSSDADAIFSFDHSKPFERVAVVMKCTEKMCMEDVIQAETQFMIHAAISETPILGIVTDLNRGGFGWIYKGKGMDIQIEGKGLVYCMQFQTMDALYSCVAAVILSLSPLPSWSKVDHIQSPFISLGSGGEGDSAFNAFGIACAEHGQHGFCRYEKPDHAILRSIHNDVAVQPESSQPADKGAEQAQSSASQELTV